MPNLPLNVEKQRIFEANQIVNKILKKLGERERQREREGSDSEMKNFRWKKNGEDGAEKKERKKKENEEARFREIFQQFSSHKLLFIFYKGFYSYF